HPVVMLRGDNISIKQPPAVQAYARATGQTGPFPMPIQPDGFNRVASSAWQQLAWQNVEVDHLISDRDGSVNRKRRRQKCSDLASISPGRASIRARRSASSPQIRSART